MLQNIAIDRDKVLKLIRNLNTNKAQGCDDISASMIEICDCSIVEPLCLIFEKCLDTGKYPSIWKKANLVPVHKKGSRQCKKNYRPISLLPLFGKMFEKLIYDYIYEHLCDNVLLTQHQSGFRPGDSTVNQLLAISHKIYCAFDDVPSKETRAVFLDLSKAFDRVWHKGLLYKLECSGISGSLLALIRDFLANREQRVLLNGKNSEWATISAGVPQGSVLGPLFFLVYVNDLVDDLNSDVKIFADDTSLFSVVNLWAWQWKMQFNADKTVELIFSTKRVKAIHPPLLLGNDMVNEKAEHKHVGMVLDSKLDFQSHIKEAILKARRGIGLMRHISNYVSWNVLNQMYKLYVRPHLDYGDIVYHRHDHEMLQSFTRELEQTQYLAALAVTGAWRGTNRQRLYEELGWESLYQRSWYRRLCHFLRLKSSHHPEYLYAEIPPERQVMYNLRRARLYEQDIGRTVRFSNTYFQHILFEWNSLILDIRNSTSIAEFKRKLLGIIRPAQKPTYSIHDIAGIRLLTKLRVNFKCFK